MMLYLIVLLIFPISILTNVLPSGRQPAGTRFFGKFGRQTRPCTDTQPVSQHEENSYDQL